MNWSDFGAGFWVGYIIAMAVEILIRKHKHRAEKQPHL